MLVTLHGNAKETHSRLEGHYILQTDLVNEKPWWLDDKNAIWADEDGWWFIASKEKLGKFAFGLLSTNDVKYPNQALTWEYYNDDWIKSKNIFVTGTGIII